MLYFRTPILCIGVLKQEKFSIHFFLIARPAFLLIKENENFSGFRFSLGEEVGNFILNSIALVPPTRTRAIQGIPL
jgi:hypothetical protein